MKYQKEKYTQPTCHTSWHQTFLLWDFNSLTVFRVGKPKLNRTVILPTGKTPEHCIKWTRYLLENRDKPEMGKMRNKIG